MAGLIKHTRCPSCGSSDGLATYDDGSTYCWSGKHVGRRDTQPGKQHEQQDMEGKLEFKDVARLPLGAMASRGISAEVASKYGIRIESDPVTGKEAVYYYPIYRGGEVVAYQFRRLPKGFGRLPSGVKDALPFGANVAGTGGKMLVVTEGADDALAAYQMFQQQGKNYRVVATLGTDGWARNLGYFESFEKVVIAYDQDEAGRRAASNFAGALSRGKAVIMSWDGNAKDPNDLLREADGSARFLNALYKAEPYRPDGVITGEEVWQRMQDYRGPETIPYPPEWADLAKKLGGLRAGEISMWTAGSSVGKTSYIRRLKQHILATSQWKIGEIELEEQAEKTWRGMMQFQAGKLWSHMTQAEQRAAYEATYGTQRIFTLDHRSQYTRGQPLIGKLKHLVHSDGVKIIMLDHVTLAVNEFGDGAGLQAQDQMMSEFLELVETTGVHLCLISHLRKPPGGGKTWSQGAVPTEEDMKGSGSLYQIAFDVISVSRNKMHEDEYERNVSQLHVTKCRETGDTGPADRLYWDREAQALVPARDPPSDGDKPATDSEF